MKKLINKASFLTEELQEMFKKSLLATFGTSYRYAVMPETGRTDIFGIKDKIVEWVFNVSIETKVEDIHNMLIDKICEGKKEGTTTLNFRKEPTVLYNDNPDKPEFIVYCFGVWS